MGTKEFQFAHSEQIMSLMCEAIDLLVRLPYSATTNERVRIGNQVVAVAEKLNDYRLSLSDRHEVNDDGT